jgi:hypothetical protein
MLTTTAKVATAHKLRIISLHSFIYLSHLNTSLIKFLFYLFNLVLQKIKIVRNFSE